MLHVLPSPIFCEKPHGASDFLAIANRFDTVFVDHIPLLDADKRNETKRFIILIDALYDHSVRLLRLRRLCLKTFWANARALKVSNSIAPPRAFSKCEVRTIWLSTTKNGREFDILDAISYVYVRNYASKRLKILATKESVANSGQ